MPLLHRLVRAAGALLMCAGLLLVGATASAAQEAAPPQPSAAPPERPWSGTVRLEVGGRSRSVFVLLPAGLPARAPLVLGLHGLYATRDSTEATMQLLRAAPSRRAIVAYPAGLDASWNAGSCCGRSAAAGVDDVAFLRRVVAEVARLHPVDLSRVSAVGYSNGGMMAHRLACDAPGLLSAVAVVAGADLTGAGCASVPATPTTVVHGGRDTVVPEAGVRWSAFLGTALPPLARTTAALQRRNDAAGVRTLLVRLPTEAHGWPTPRSVSGYDTTREVLDFVLRSRHPLGVRAARGR